MSDCNSAKANSAAKGFTLIELLVVISIIALLLSILMPALNRVKEAGKRAVCLSNLKSLGISWVLYAENNDDRIVNAMTTPIREIGINRFDWNDSLSNFWSYFHGPSWVGWWGGDDLEAKIATIEMGTLYPYIETLELYCCPMANRGEVRSYAIADSMNGYDDVGNIVGNAGETVVKKISMVRRPSERMVFIDEGYATPESWTLCANAARWWDAVPLRHSAGTNMSFADGHSDYRKWDDNRTIEFAEEAEAAMMAGRPYNQPSADQLNNKDLMDMQRAVWGRAHKP